ncbi:hypothetical protein SUGI_0885080 [Cryptomeria japonica]|nr:hypothetical protein SUGI_0885080 [Cryptomeria japonica]
MCSPLFKNNESTEQVALTNFYGAQSLDGLKRQWAVVQSMRHSWADVDWIVAGDFNAKLSPTDQEGDLPSLDPRDHFMIAQLLELNLVDVIDPNSKFTWTNKRVEPHSRKVKPDRFLVSEAAFSKWHLNLHVFDDPISDHSPILLDGGIISSFHNHPFRFENFWFQKEEL